jgi:hypothetical protein
MMSPFETQALAPAATQVRHFFLDPRVKAKVINTIPSARRFLPKAALPDDYWRRFVFDGTYIPPAVQELLFENPILRPCYIAVLNEDRNEAGSLVPVEADALSALGGPSVLDRFTGFSAGTEDGARAMMAQGYTVLVAVTDQYTEGETLYHIHKVANGRQAFFPLPDGTWLGIKNSGQFVDENQPPFFIKKPEIAGDPEYWGIGFRDRIDDAARMHLDVMHRGGESLTQWLAWRPLHVLCDGRGGLVRAVEFPGPDGKPLEPVLQFIRSVEGPYRIVKWPQMLATDYRLKRMERLAAVLFYLGLEQIILTPAEIILRAMRRWAAAEAGMANSGFNKCSSHFQDLTLAGEDNDSDEFRDLTRFTEHQVRAGCCLMTRHLLRQYGFPVIALTNKFYTLAVMARTARAYGETFVERLFPEPLEPMRELFQSYFKKLDTRFLQSWLARSETGIPIILAGVLHGMPVEWLFGENRSQAADDPHSGLREAGRRIWNWLVEELRTRGIMADPLSPNDLDYLSFSGERFHQDVQVALGRAAARLGSQWIKPESVVPRYSTLIEKWLNGMIGIKVAWNGPSINEGNLLASFWALEEEMYRLNPVYGRVKWRMSAGDAFPPGFVSGAPVTIPLDRIGHDIVGQQEGTPANGPGLRPDITESLRNAIEDSDGPALKPFVEAAFNSDLDYFILLTTLNYWFVRDPGLKSLYEHHLEVLRRGTSNPGIVSFLDRLVNQSRDEKWEPPRNGIIIDGNFHYTTMPRNADVPKEADDLAELMPRIVRDLLSDENFLLGCIRDESGNPLLTADDVLPLKRVLGFQAGRYHVVHLVLMTLRDGACVSFILNVARNYRASRVVEEEYRCFSRHQDDSIPVKVLRDASVKVSGKTIAAYAASFTDNSDEIIYLGHSASRDFACPPGIFYVNSSHPMRGGPVYRQEDFVRILAAAVAAQAHFYDETAGTMIDRFTMPAGDLNLDGNAFLLGSSGPFLHGSKFPRSRLIAWRGDRKGIAPAGFLMHLFSLNFLNANPLEIIVDAASLELIPRAVFMGLGEELTGRRGRRIGLETLHQWLKSYLEDPGKKPGWADRFFSGDVIRREMNAIEEELRDNSAEEFPHAIAPLQSARSAA